jgi:hypothetical protein
MRVTAVAVMTIAIIVMGLSLRPAPHATAAAPEQTRVQIDPDALQSTINPNSLPSQDFADPF